MEIQLEGVSSFVARLSFIIMNENWKIEENEMKTKYKLIVKESGNYAADSLTELIWIVLKHRCQHVLKGEGWSD